MAKKELTEEISDLWQIKDLEVVTHVPWPVIREEGIPAREPKEARFRMRGTKVGNNVLEAGGMFGMFEQEGKWG